MMKVWAVVLVAALAVVHPSVEAKRMGGGGSMGDATSHGSWNPGNEGVRITVVRASNHAVVTTPFDLTNKQPAAGIYHFGKVSKTSYRNGAGLSARMGGYTFYNPAQSLPQIISTSRGGANLTAIKQYFTDEQASPPCRLAG